MVAPVKRIFEIDVTTSKGLQAGIRQVNTQLRSIEGNAKKTAREVKKMSKSFDFMTAAAGAFIALRVIKSVTGIADSMILLSARVNLVAEATVGTTKAMDDLFDVSKQTRSAIEASASLYARLGLATAQLGTTHDDLIKAVQTTANTLVLSGAGAQEAKASMIQLSQAFAKGKLDGDEFRTMTENNVFMFDLLARGLNKTRRELYAMSKAGELTSQLVLGVLVDNAEEVQKKMDEIPLTFGHVSTQVSNAFSKMALDAQGSIKFLTDALTSVPGFLLGIKESLEEQFAFLAAVNAGDVSPWKLLTADQDEITRIMFDLNQGYRDIAAGVDGYRKQLNDLDPVLEGMRTNLVKTQKALDLYKDEGFTNKVDETTKRLNSQKAAINAVLVARGKLQQKINEGLQGPTGLEDRDKPTTTTLPEVTVVEKGFSDYELKVLKANDASELLLDNMSELDNLFQDGLINVEVYASENEKLEKALLGSAKGAKVAEKALDEMGVAIGQTLANGIDQLGDSLFDAFMGIETSFKQVIGNILEDVGRLILKLTLLNAIKAGLSGTGVGDFLFPSASAKGNVFNNGEITAFATGGVVDSPTYFPMTSGTGLMGEDGPEAILPLSRGTDGKLGVSVDGSGGPKSVHVNIVNEGTESQVTSSTSTTDINGTVINIVLDDIRQGGVLRNAIKGAREF